MDKGSGSGIFPDPDPGDPKRPDPNGSGSATLVIGTTVGGRTCDTCDPHSTHVYCKYIPSSRTHVKSGGLFI